MVDLGDSKRPCGYKARSQLSVAMVSKWTVH